MIDGVDPIMYCVVLNDAAIHYIQIANQLETININIPPLCRTKTN